MPKKVWEINYFENGFLDFWDFFDEIEYTDSLITAFNNMKDIEEPGDLAENLVSCYLIKCAIDGKNKKMVKPRKYSRKNIENLIKSIGGYVKIGYRDKKDFDLSVMRKLKYELFPEHYQNIVSLTKI